MGLDTTHDAFSGAYSAFNRFRQVIARAAGGSYPPHAEPLTVGDEIIEKPDQGMLYVPDWTAFQEDRPGLSAFLVSNDCEGKFPPDLCKQMADEMEALLPDIDKISPEYMPIGGRQIADVARQYIAGCRAAHAARENLEYR